VRGDETTSGLAGKTTAAVAGGEDNDDNEEDNNDDDRVGFLPLFFLFKATNHESTMAKPDWGPTRPRLGRLYSVVSGVGRVIPESVKTRGKGVSASHSRCGACRSRDDSAVSTPTRPSL